MTSAGYSELPNPISKDAKAILADNGWDKGLVVFGAAVSESTVKVVTAVHLLKKQDNFPYKEIKFVDTPFDESDLKTASDGKQSVGVSNKLYINLTEGKGFMPAVAIDGRFMVNAYDIVQYFWNKYPDTSLNTLESQQISDLLQLNTKYSESNFEALKHWGWCAMNGSKPNYQHLGYGKKDLAWEKAAVKKVDEFFCAFEDFLKKRKVAGLEVNGFLVGNKISLADCALLNWAGSFSLVLGMNIQGRYPLVQQNWEQLKAKAPEGSSDHYGTFPIFCMIVGVLNSRNRGTGLCCLLGRGFYMDNPVYW